VANIQLKITALGDFSSVNNQLKALQTQVTSLQKSIAGIGLNNGLANQLKTIQSEFSNALVSSGNFTKQTVQLTSETERFGQALQKGQLSLGQYFGIITGKSASAKASVNALAQEQVKLNNSIVQQDITKQGVYSVFTPTTIDPIAKSVEIAAAKQNIFNLAVKNGSQELINFGKNTQWAGRQLTVGLSMPAILFGSQAVASFKAVNTELTRLQRLYGEGLTPPSQAQLNAISNQVINLGKQVAQQMGIAQSATVQVAANFAAMGIQGQKLLDVTYQAQRLSKLGAIDATQATNAIVSLQNVYKVSSTDLGNAVNFLSSMQKQTTMSLQDMTDAIPRVGPIMAQLGGGYKDTAVMLLAMREAGVPAAQAANALKSAFASIIAPTAAANKEFASFGINLTNIRNAGTPTQMLMALQSALAPLNKMAQEQLIEKLFGKFQFARISALLDNFGKVGSQTQNALKVAGATNSQLAGLANQEMAQATESSTAKWQRAIETLKADLYPIGQKILEVGTKLIDFGQKIADFFNKLPGPIKNGLGILLTLGVLAGPIIMITGLLANLMGQGMKVGYAILGMIDGTRKWKDLMTPAGVAAKVAMDAMNTGVLENVTAVDTLNAALQRLITSLEALNMNFQVGTDTSLLGRVEAAAAGEAAAGTLLLPGMATGGYVPGNPAQGDVYPALLMGGEAVIPTKQAEKYAPFINAMIQGNLPQHAFGVGKFGKRVKVERGHAAEEYSPEELANFNANVGQDSTGLEGPATALVRGLMLLMHANTNQGTKSTNKGKTGAEIAQGYRDVQSTGIDPLQNLKDQAKALGVDMATFEPKINAAFEDFLKTLETTKANYIFGGKKAKERAEKEGKVYGGTLEAETGMSNGPIMSTLNQTQTAGRSSFGSILSRIAGTRGLRSGRKSATGNAFFEETPGNFVPLSESKELQGYKDLDKLTPSQKENLFSTKSAYDIKGAETSKKLPKAVAYDIDETLAETKGINGPGEKWIDSTVGAKPIGPEVARLNKLKEQGNKIVILTARTEHHQAQTLAWLKANDIPFDELVMRGKGDNQPDDVYKGQKLQQLLEKYRVNGLVDDKPENLAAAESLGIKGIPAYGRETAVKTDAATREGFEERSPSKKGIKTGKDYFAGVKQGMEETAPSLWTEGRDAAQKIHQGVDEGLNGSAGQSKIQSIFSRAFGANSRLGGMMSKFSGMGMMGRMGVGMGITTASQIASPLLNKLPGGSLITDAMSGAGMGAGFGPWGMAAGAAISLVTGGIKSLMAAEKQHAAEAQADFTSSADAVQIMGGKVADTKSLLTSFNVVMSTSPASVSNGIVALGKNITYTTTQLSNFMSMVKTLPTNNPLALVIKQVKDAGDSGSAAKLAAEFANLQIAVNGISAAQAKQLEQLILTAGGKDAGSALTPISNQIDAMKASLNAALPNAKQFAQVIGQITSAALNSNSLTNVQNAIKAIGLSAASSAQQVAGLLQYFTQLGNSGAIQLITLMQSKGGFSGSDVVTALSALTSGATVNFDTLSKDLASGKTVKDTIAAMKTKSGLQKQLNDLQAKANDLQSGSAVTTAANNAAVSNNVSGLTKQQKLLDANLKALQDLQKQQTQNTNYATTKEDLKNQILMAQATGDNLKAQLLQQQLIGTTKDFNLQTNVDKAQQAADANRTALDAANAAVTQAQTTATNNNTSALAALNKQISDLQAKIAAGGTLNTSPDSGKRVGTPPTLNSTADIKAKNGTVWNDKISGQKYRLVYNPKGGSEWYGPNNSVIPVTTKATGGDITGPGTSTSDSIPAMLSNGEYVINAGAVQHYGKGTFDALNSKHLAKGGVARTNSSITYHRQHMNRISRHFASGGYVNPISAVIGSLMGGVGSSIGNMLGFAGDQTSEIVGVDPMARILQGRSQGAWDYLGAGTMLAGPMKGLGLLPEIIKPLIGMMEAVDVTQNVASAPGYGQWKNATGSNHVYNVNVHVDKVDSTVDMTKAINDALAKATAKANMSGRVSKVGS